MIQEKQWYRKLVKASDCCNGVINFVCILLLTAQVLSILMMVFGRYIFNRVPAWTEQFALFCMVWFAMFSIALGVRTDAHVKVELVDKLVSAKVLLGFKLFGNFCTMIFGLIMCVYGVALSRLTWGTMLSAFRVPTGLQYLSAVAGGLFMIINAIIYCIELIAKTHDAKLQKEGDAV